MLSPPLTEPGVLDPEVSPCVRSFVLHLRPPHPATTDPVVAAAALVRPAEDESLRQGEEAAMTLRTLAARAATRTRRGRELVCTYRPLRDASGRIVGAPTWVLSTSSWAARAVAPLIADQVIEVVRVACVSTGLRLLAWHLVSRGTRSSSPISMPDDFVPARLRPGTTGLIVVHNHPSGDHAPSPEDVALTRRLQSAGAILDLPLQDHLIVGENARYSSVREAGAISALRPCTH